MRVSVRERLGEGSVVKDWQRVGRDCGGPREAREGICCELRVEVVGWGCGVGGGNLR